MNSSLLRLLAAGAMYYAARATGSPTAWSARRLRGWLIGIGLIIGSSAIGIFGLIILLSSLFFQLADSPQLVRPALITGGVSLLLSALGFLQGMRWFRR